MANSRLTSQLVLASSKIVDAMRNTQEETLTIPAGNYWPEELWAVLIDRWFTAFGVDDLEVYANGAGVVADSAKAEGRLRFQAVDATSAHFDFVDSASYLDARILGFVPGVGVKAFSGAGDITLWSDHVHRYGWYPQAELLGNISGPIPQVENSVTIGGYRQTKDFGEFGAGKWEWKYIHRALVRIAAAANAESAAQMLLTQGDLNCALERFVVDVVRNNYDFRVYEDITSETFLGPFGIPKGSGLLANPLALSRPVVQAGEKWDCGIEGRESTRVT